jgi:hypothetical protein
VEVTSRREQIKMCDMRSRRAWYVLPLTALLVAAPSASAITIKIDYTYDTSNFFGSGNPQGATGGAQAKAAIEAAASYYGQILTDTFDPITVPSVYHSTFPGSNATVSWSWSESFTNPSSSSPDPLTISGPSVAANQYVVYVGGRALDGDTAGQGGPGGYTTANVVVGGDGNFTQTDVDNANAKTNTFNQQITTRGQSSGFSDWGGSASFDNDGSTQWYFNYQGTPSGNVTDFYTTAIHELAHALGFGLSSQWKSLVNNHTFYGVNAENQNMGNAVPLDSIDQHWTQGTTSVVYGTSIPQEVVMEPKSLNGTRKKLTALDAAGLEDIGWTLGTLPGVSGDYNNNGVVDADDYVVWRKNVGKNVTLPNRVTTGMIGTADYNAWRANFGKSVSGSGSGLLAAGGTVPEPTAGVLVALLLLCMSCSRARGGR